MVFSQTPPHADLFGKVTPARSSKAPAGIALGINTYPRKPSRDANAPSMLPWEGGNGPRRVTNHQTHHQR